MNPFLATLSEEYWEDRPKLAEERQRWNAIKRKFNECVSRGEDPEEISLDDLIEMLGDD